MKRIVTLSVAAFILFSSGAGMTAQSVASFVGLWEGVDPNDGGHQILSVTDNKDGTLRLLLHDTTYTLCPTDKGISEGTGIIQPDGTLNSENFTLKCLATETPQSTPTSFQLEKDVLHRIRTAPLDPIDYHKTSNQ
jgi:hypothetical protein